MLAVEYALAGQIVFVYLFEVGQDVIVLLGDYEWIMGVDRILSKMAGERL